MSGSRATMALAAVAIIAGCGDDSDSENGDAAKEQYLERANAICAELGARTEALAERRLGERTALPSRRQRGAYEARVAALQREALAELRALPAPPGDEQRLAEVYDAMEAAIDAVAALSPDDPGRPGEEPVVRFNELARDYGLMDCADQSA